MDLRSLRGRHLSEEAISQTEGLLRRSASLKLRRTPRNDIKSVIATARLSRSRKQSHRACKNLFQFASHIDKNDCRRTEKQPDGSPVASFAASATVAVASQPAHPALPALPPGEEIYDLMPAHSVGLPILYILGQVLLVILVFWLLGLFYRWLTTPVQRPRRKLELSPQQTALRAIARLERSPVWQQRQMKEICESVAAILKTYAHDAYAIGIGAAATTDEFLESFRRTGMAAAIFARSRDLLNDCDQIKFAGVEGDPDLADGMLSELKQLITQEGWQQ
ncbi:MAG: hypothetical protein GQF41_0334 [Candidatus Rifleibacterium amylolyticum]|nr:MAG: hypothetical protein GQF41_0334 [Candidatus Rifleibacterium amylolyticum]